MSHHRHDSPIEHGTSPYLRYAFWGFAAIAVFFLITEHGAHLFGFLPFLLILACPLMHMFGHHGHRHGGHGAGGPEEPRRAPEPGDPPTVAPDAREAGPETGHHPH